jgi:hypothetical protein
MPPPSVPSVGLKRLRSENALVGKCRDAKPNDLDPFDLDRSFGFRLARRRARNHLFITAGQLTTSAIAACVALGADRLTRKRWPSAVTAYGSGELSNVVRNRG